MTKSPHAGSSKRRLIVLSSDDEEQKVKKKSKPVINKTPRRTTPQSPSSDAANSTWRPHGIRYHAVDLVKPLQEDLLAWFEESREKRGMPWRKKYDKGQTDEEKGQRAYEIWISEVMLQQTQVTTVIPYWLKWMEKWPTISDLARADIETDQEVNSAWRGLGYYRRARALLSAAQKVAASPKKYHGRLPSDPAVMVSDIDGVGKYTAGAICSMAYGVTTPIVDGNVHRLLSRLLALHAPTTSPSLIKKLWDSAEELVNALQDSNETGKAGDWNQALMELGSQVCKPVAPDCGNCPLRRSCKAHSELSSYPPPPKSSTCSVCVPPIDLDPQDMPASGGAVGSVTIFPMKKAKPKSRDEWTVACFLSWKCDAEEKWLLVKRPDKGLLAGLFEPPSIQVEEDTSQADQIRAARDYIKTLLTKSDRLATESGHSNYHGELVHIFSHIRMTYLVHSLQIIEGDAPPALTRSESSTDMLWMTKDEVLAANIGTGVKKIWDLVYSSRPSKTTKLTKDKKEGKEKKEAKDTVQPTKITKRIAMPMMPF